jgi:hypothetical protein
MLTNLKHLRIALFRQSVCRIVIWVGRLGCYVAPLYIWNYKSNIIGQESLIKLNIPMKCINLRFKGHLFSFKKRFKYYSLSYIIIFIIYWKYQLLKYTCVILRIHLYFSTRSLLRLNWVDFAREILSPFIIKVFQINS